MPTSIFAEPASPLILSDRLLTLAQQAETAGLAQTASRLVILAHTVLDEFSIPPAYRLANTASSRAAIAA